MRSVKYRIESENGDDSFTLPADQTQPQVEKLLSEDKLVTIEKKDGSTELLTKKDVPDWQNVFSGKKAEPETKKVEEEDEEDDEEEGDDEDEPEIKPLPASPYKPAPTPQKSKVVKVQPKEQQPILSDAVLKQNEWAKKFKEVKSVTATKKQQGG